MKTKVLFNKKKHEFEKGTLWACIDTPIIILCSGDSGPMTFEGIIAYSEKDSEDAWQKVGIYATDWLKARFEYFNGELTMQQ